MKMPWWIGDSSADYVQNIVIRGMQEAQEWENAADLGVAEQVGKILQITRSQAEHIARLELSLQTLTGVLVESNIVSEEDLKSRFEAAWNEMQAEQVEEAKRQENALITCAGCGTQVEKRDTFFSELGEVCSNCV
jgi:hypothetical protein